MEIFFAQIIAKRNKQIGLFITYNWYKKPKDNKYKDLQS
jgi:hypothetical protein